LDGIAAQHTVEIQGTGGARVIGGRLWRPNVPASLAVTTAFVEDGRAATTSPRPVTVNGRRMVCVCSVGPGGAAGLVLSPPSHVAGLSRWLGWPELGLVLLGIAVLFGLAYLLARVLTRPIARLAEEVAAVARGEPDVQPAVDPGAGRDLYQVATTL